MSEDGVSKEAWKAPYVSYETFGNFFEKKIGNNPLPPRIDTHFLDNYAGSIRPLLIAALKSTGMIGEQNEVLEPLREAVRSPEARKAVLSAWAQSFYAEQYALAQRNATASMLWESFTRRGYTGSTMRKAVVFFLNLSEDLGLPKSPHFKAPRAAASSNGSRAKVTGRSATPSVTPASDTEQTPNQPRPAGERKVVTLGGAGTVTVFVDVRWLDLPDETFTNLRKAIRDLESLSQPEDDELQSEENDS